MKKILVIVEQPLQLINAYHYLYEYNLLDVDIDFIFLTIISKSNLEQLRNTFSVLKLKGNIKEITVFNAIKPNPFKRVILFLKLKRILKKLKKEDYSLKILGHIRSNYQLILANTSSAKRIHVDDGSATYLDIQLLHHKKRTYFLSKIKVQVYKTMGFDPKIQYTKGKLFFYTLYENAIIPNHKFLEFELNKLSVLKEKLSVKPINSSTIFFLGTNLVPKIIDFEVFESILKKIVKFYKQSGKNVIYFPHREESFKVENLIKQNGWIIHKENMPFEITVLNMKERPYEFGMFFTSAADSVLKLIPDAKFKAFYIKEEQLSSKWRRGIVVLYEKYKLDPNIELKNLDY